MRIAFVSVSDQLGGSEAVLLHLVGELRRARPSWEVHAIVPGGGPLGARAAALGARVHVVPMPPAIASVGEWATGGHAVGMLRQVATAARALPSYEHAMASTLAAIGPDVVHTNGFKAHLVVARIATTARRVWHLHEYVSRRPATRRLLRRYAPAPDAVVANSHSVGEDITAVLGDRLTRSVEIIHNGIDLEKFSPGGSAADIDTACGLPPAAAGTVRVGLIATFARWKGQDVFLRALAELPPQVPVRGYVIGGPVYDTAGSQWSVEELRAGAGASNANGRVGFTGFQHDMPAFVRALDVVVHASTEPEPFGLVIAEAMGCAKPVISTGAGGAGEIVQPGTALLFDPGDHGSLARAIETLAGDAAMRARLGAAGRAVVEAHFSVERFGDAFVTLYESVIPAGAA